MDDWEKADRFEAYDRYSRDRDRRRLDGFLYDMRVASARRLRRNQRKKDRDPAAIAIGIEMSSPANRALLP
jgi:hypothetical protein